MCEKKIKKPRVLFPSILAPTEPMTNIGPEVEDRHMARRASVDERSPSFFISPTIFAPIGYPEIIDIINGYVTVLGQRYSEVVTGDIKRSNFLNPPSPSISFDKNKKGRSEGKTETKKSEIPEFMLEIYFSGLITSKISAIANNKSVIFKKIL